MVCVFTRTITDELAGLVSAIDESLDTHSDEKLAGFLVYMTDDPDAPVAELKAMAEQHQLKQLPLTVFPESRGPGAYRIAGDQETTVVLWREKHVTQTFEFPTARLNDQAADDVLEGIAQLLN